ncbi:MAG: FliH/SctL family protein [Desulfatirhabdiaceae bacterium]
MDTNSDSRTTEFEADNRQMFKGNIQGIESSRDIDLSKQMGRGSNAVENLIDEEQKKVNAAYEKGLQQGKQKGLAQGKKAGYDQGMKEGRQAVEPIINFFNQAIESVEDFKKKLYMEAQEEAVKLSLSLARKIICSEPAIQPDILLNVTRKALTMTDQSEIVRIRIHPSESEYLCRERSNLKISDRVMLVADGAIEPGCCMIETLSGDMDARLLSQIQVLEEAFEQELLKFRSLKTPGQ